MKIVYSVCLWLVSCVLHASSPITGLIERIDKGASKRFIIEKEEAPKDFFELDQRGDKVVIRGNNYSFVEWHEGGPLVAASSPETRTPRDGFTLSL